MNWEAVGAIAELLGAIGVIASLVYLASQIRQSATVNRLTLQENFVTGLSDVFSRIYSDPDVHRVWKLGITAPDEMSEDDRERLGMIYHILYQRLALVWHAGELDSPIGARTLRFIDQSARFPATQSWWSRQRGLFDPAFAAYVDERIRLARTGESPTDEGAA